MSDLNTINEQIRSLQLARVELKKEVLKLEELKALEERQKEYHEHLANCEVYLNDTGKRYPNDNARKAAVKQILLDNSAYTKAENCIVSLSQDLNNLEIQLRENRIQIDFLMRQFDLNLVK